MYSPLHKLSEYTYFYISKNATSKILFCCLFLKSSKAFIVSLSKLSDVAKNNVVKNIVYSELVKKFNAIKTIDKEI